MSIQFNCPICKTSYTVGDQDAGKKSACKTCGQRLQVPAPIVQKTILGEIRDPLQKNSNRKHSDPDPTNDASKAKETSIGTWWHYTASEDKKISVSFDQLCSMAQTGRVRRRDYVKRKGEERWRRAGRVEELWPAIRLSDEARSALTECGACLGQLAKEAPTCPKCGAPNAWMHPESIRFLGRLRKFQRSYTGFDVEAKGFTLVGRSYREKQFMDYAASAVGSMGFVGPLSLTGLAITLGASIGSKYAAKALQDKAGPDHHLFVIDFRHDPPLWSTTDDGFWEDVLDFFDLI